MHNGITLGYERVYNASVTHIPPDEAVTRVGDNVSEVFQISRVRERIQIDHLVS